MVSCMVYDWLWDVLNLGVLILFNGLVIFVEVLCFSVLWRVDNGMWVLALCCGG